MIKGKLINLRPVTRADLPLLEKWSNDQEFQSEFNFFGYRGTEGYARQFEEDGMQGIYRGTFMVVTPEGEEAGDISYRSQIYGANDASRAFNIGISLAPAHRGKGYGVEAQMLLADYLFKIFNVIRVEASTDITNIAEQRALEKAGFTREGVLRKVQWRNGSHHDLVVYGKLRGE